MNIGKYSVERKLADTGHSILYEVKTKDEDWDDFLYVIKKYCSNAPKSDAIKELHISRLLEKNSKVSVSIPILKKFKFEGQVCLVMQLKKNGIFLKDLFEAEASSGVACDQVSSEVEASSGVACDQVSFCDQGSFCDQVSSEAGASSGVALTCRKILEITDKILSSLRILHEFHYEGKRDMVLHLDLHPGNIFIENYESDAGGEIKFIDFSNAFEERIKESYEDIDPLPSAYSHFSAPEVLDYETEKICEGTDLYSVASIMFWMMTGKAYESSMNLYDEIYAYGAKENLPSVVSCALLQFLQCGVDVNTLYRFKTASDMKDALLQIVELVDAVDKCDYTSVTSRSFDMMIPLWDARVVPMRLSAPQFEKAISELEKNTMTYHIDVARRKYEFDYYWEMVKKQRAEGISELRGELMLRLIRCGITVCNYSSDAVLGEEMRREYEKFKDNIPIMEYLGLSATLAEQDVDKCRYREALERNENSIKCMEMIKETYSRCADLCDMKGRGATEYKDLARTYSAAGRCMSFIAWECEGAEREEMSERAVRYFDRALAEFGEDTINRQISLYHLLHLLIDMRSTEQFEKYVPEYLGHSSLVKWVAEYVADGNSDLYKLHLCLRGLYYLYPDEIYSDEVWGASACSDEVWGASDEEVTAGEGLAANLKVLQKQLIRGRIAHPVELVHKYIGLLLFKCEHKVTREVRNAFRYAVKSFGVDDLDGISEFDLEKPLDIMEVIAYQTMSIYNTLCGREDEISALCGLLMDRCKNSGWVELGSRLRAGVSITEILGYEYT